MDHIPVVQSSKKYIEEQLRYKEEKLESSEIKVIKKVLDGLEHEETERKDLFHLIREAWAILFPQPVHAR